VSVAEVVTMKRVCMLMLLWCSLAVIVRADAPGTTQCGAVTADGFRFEEFLGRTWRMNSCKCH